MADLLFVVGGRNLTSIRKFEKAEARRHLNDEARRWVPQALYGRLDRVFVPDMYEELTTQRVLVMEWVNGSRLRSGTDGVLLGLPVADQLRSMLI